MKKNMKKRLIASVLSLVLCFAMLLGTTYAWFTDSVTSGKNKIVAGTLDIELEYKNDTQTTFATVDENTNVLKEGALWEPGHVEYAVLNVKNVGTLDLKYNLSITVASETEGTNKAGESFKLSSYIQYAVVEGDLTGKTRSEMIAAAGEGTALNQAYASNDSLLDGENTIITLVVWMPESVGNEANYKLGTTVPEILLGVSLVATQLTSEVDSFDDQYDALAPWIGGTDDAGLAANTDATAKTVKIESADQLASFANAVNGGADYTGYTVTLETDVNLNNTPWSPINAGYWSMTFDGQDHTIYNLNVTGEKNVGFFGTFTSDTLKNLTIDGATVTGSNHVAAMAGDGLCASFDKCVVKNAVITTTVKDNDDGDKAGAICGYLSGEPYAAVTNCAAEKCTIKGYRDIAALVGYANGDAVVTGNTAKDIVLINDRSCNYKNYTTDAAYDVTADSACGEAVATATVENNTLTNVTKEVELQKWVGGTDDAGLAANTNATAKTVVIASQDQLASFANKVNGGADYTNYTVTLATDIDLNNTPWSPINAGFWGMTFDGQDHTIYNLNVTGEKNVGFFGTFTSDTLKNLTIDGATVTGINHVAAMAGDGLCAHFDKCVVKNAVITAAVKDNDDGDKVGAITGYLSAEPYASITNCSVEKSTIKGYRDVAAIVGYVNCDQATVTGNTATDVVIINDRSNNYKSYTAEADYDVSATTVYGENASTGAVYQNNTLTNVTKQIAP